MYLDKNNLYGWAMSQYLAYGGFEGLKNVDNFDVNSSSEKSPIGYIIEVDLKYPNELHELHNEYPLTLDKLAVSYDMLSNNEKIPDEYGIKVCDVKKLVPNLANKTNYKLHYRNPQLYLSLGMKLNKIHRVLKFKQSNWMKAYIDLNTEKRKNAANSFEKGFFKLMTNRVYGKPMKNFRK